MAALAATCRMPHASYRLLHAAFWLVGYAQVPLIYHLSALIYLSAQLQQQQQQEQQQQQQQQIEHGIMFNDVDLSAQRKDRTE